MTGALEVTTLADLKKIREGDLVELPPFTDGTPFVAKLRRPSLIHMAKLGQIPNPLLPALDDLLDVGRETGKSGFMERLDLLMVVAKASMEEPVFEDVEPYIDPLQLLALWAYVTSGVEALVPFRAIRSIFATHAYEQAVELSTEPVPEP